MCQKEGNLSLSQIFSMSFFTERQLDVYHIVVLDYFFFTTWRNNDH